MGEIQAGAGGPTPGATGAAAQGGGASIPPELEAELTKINTGIGRYVSKGVAFVLTPLLLPLMTSLAYGIQKWFGLKLDAAQLTGYLTAIAAGIGLTAYKWISNRGEWERTVLQLSQWYKLGSQAQAAGQPLPPPPPH
jgi:hypothetical protein